MTSVAPEFSRKVRVDTLGADPLALTIDAGAAERAALAKRFGLVGIEHLSAQVSLTRDGANVSAIGTLDASVTQNCVASGVPIEALIKAPFAIQFSRPPDPQRGVEEEIELGEADCDVVFYSGADVDIGDAVAETLLLSLDPWPRAPGAEEILKRAGIKSEEEAGIGSEEQPSPFAALAALKDKLKG